MAGRLSPCELMAASQQVCIAKYIVISENMVNNRERGSDTLDCSDDISWCSRHNKTMDNGYLAASALDGYQGQWPFTASLRSV